MPKLSDTLPEIQAEFAEAAADPIAANAAVQAALDAATPWPEAELPPDDLVNLPGGLLVKGEVIRTAIVQELTGVHEEALARATQSQNPFHFVNTLLDCGTVQFGDENKSRTKELLKQALVGDRDAIILGIRRATYGDVIDLKEWECPECGNKSDLSIPITSIPVTYLEKPQEETVFEVSLRKGKSARVRLVNGADQTAIFEDPKLNPKQMDSIMLSRCVLAIRDADGTEHNLAGQPNLARNLSIPDRHAIIKELANRQPGPNFNDVKFVHDDCGKEVTLLLGIGDLFLDF